MKITPNLAQLQKEHVVLEPACIDRRYLNAYSLFRYGIADLRSKVFRFLLTETAADLRLATRNLRHAADGKRPFARIARSTQRRFARSRLRR